MTAPEALRIARVSRLRLFRFRNYGEASIELSAGLNLVAGENAQGKTNLLEAIATMALTRSPRASATDEVLQWGSTQCSVEAEVQRPAGATVVAMRFARGPDGGDLVRTATVDGKPRRPRDVLGLCPVVMFTPDDLQLVSSGPERRRRLLDTLLGQLNPRASLDLIQFRRVLAQRNALLRQIRAGGGGSDSLNSFTEAVASHGGRVRAARAELLASLVAPAASAISEISGERDHLSLTYMADGRTYDASMDAEGATRALQEAISTRAAEERVRGITLAGPHRDDVEIRLSDHAARSGGSQGQQRSIALALKLAEVQVVTSVAGMTPVLLLDDVLGELDRRRRDYLLTTLAGLGPLQLLVTATAPASFPTAAFSESRTFTVRDGTITDENMT